MKLRWMNRNSSVIEASPAELNWLRAEMTFRDKTAWFRGERRSARCLLSKSLVFPSGFVPVLQKELRKNPELGFEMEVVDDRSHPSGRSMAGKPGLTWLFTFQREAVERALERTRGIIQAPTGCLSGETEIRLNRAGRGFRMPLGKLVDKVNAANPHGHAWGTWDRHITTRVQALVEDDAIGLHTLAHAVASGRKRTWLVNLASGRSLRATEDHGLLSDEGWRDLGDIKPGHHLFSEAPSRTKGSVHETRPWYRLVNGLRSHPFAGRRGVNPHKGGWSVPLHRIVAESEINELSVEEFIARCRAGRIRGLEFLDPRLWAVHHRDENALNNTPTNLEVLTHHEHWARHGKEKTWRNVNAFVVADKVINIGCPRMEETFDLIMDGNPHNFLANGIVTHNSGKSEIAAGLCRALPDTTWLFSAHKRDLLDQGVERLERRLKERVGIIGEGAVDIRRVTVATHQSLISRIREGSASVRLLLESVQGLIIDECHVLGADVWNELALSCEAFWRFGLSATPMARGDGRTPLVLGAIGPVIYKISNEELEEIGLLAKPKIVMREVWQDHSIPMPEGIIGEEDHERVNPELLGTWRRVKRELIVQSAKRNKAVVRAVKDVEKPSLCFVETIAHGRSLLKALRTAGIESEFVHGTHPIEARKAAVRRLERRDTDVLVCSQIFDAGIDIPSVKSGVNASGGKSAISAVQKLGRVMRSDGGRKVEFSWIDFWDAGHDWLEEHSRERRRAYRREGHSVTIVREDAGPLFGGRQ